MKTNVKTMLMALVATSMVACSNNQDVFDGGAIEKTAKQSYAENFAKKYPNVDMNQNWDFSSKTPYFSFSNNNGNHAGTRAAVSYDFEKGETQVVDLSTVEWMKDNLKEGKPNRSLGKAFYMTVPGNEFTIMPVFQGEAGAVWDLHVVVGGVDILVWKKSQDIQLTTEANPDWHSVINEQAAEGGWEAQRNTLKATGLKAVPYTFKNLPVGEEMYFYLDIKVSGSGGWSEIEKDANGNNVKNEDGTDKWIWKDHQINEVGAHMTSVDQMMLALQGFEKPSNVPAGYEYMLIGCEDANLADSDWDMNDVVFLVYGQKIPKPIEITEGTTVYDSRTVRYMVEDLGSTDDFDFNDIVIDVTENKAKTPVYTNGVLTSWNEGETTQKAVIRHLGGTLPFLLTIGNKQLPEMGGQSTFQTSPNTEYDVTGWNINSHNISVQVQQKDNQGVYNNVVFPRAGEAPMIIAVDPSQGWMTERQSVPESWFYIPE